MHATSPCVYMRLQKWCKTVSCGTPWIIWNQKQTSLLRSEKTGGTPKGLEGKQAYCFLHVDSLSDKKGQLRICMILIYFNFNTATLHTRWTLKARRTLKSVNLWANGARPWRKHCIAAQKSMMHSHAKCFSSQKTKHCCSAEGRTTDPDGDRRGRVLRKAKAMAAPYDGTARRFGAPSYPFPSLPPFQTHPLNKRSQCDSTRFHRCRYRKIVYKYV